MQKGALAAVLLFSAMLMPSLSSRAQGALLFTEPAPLSAADLAVKNDRLDKVSRYTPPQLWSTEVGVDLTALESDWIAVAIPNGPVLQIARMPGDPGVRGEMTMWVGRVIGGISGNSAIFSVLGGVLHGIIDVPPHHYIVTHVSGNHYLILEVDLKRIPRDGHLTAPEAAGGAPAN